MADYSKHIWDYFLEKIGNKYGVAGLMGNLQAESNLNPKNLQGTYESSLGFTDDTYTMAVDNRIYSKSQFINDSAGYGLAQWTYVTRKQGLYDMWQDGGYPSIGDINLACNYLWYELSNRYTGVLYTLQHATSIRQASDAVLHDFESPADQSESVEVYRANLGNQWYSKYYNSSVVPTPGGSGGSGYKKSKPLSLLLMFQATRRKVK